MPDTWEPEPPSVQPAPPPTRPWATTIAVVLVAAVLALEVADHHWLSAAGIGVLLAGNIWAAGRLWRHYRHAKSNIIDHSVPLK